MVGKTRWMVWVLAALVALGGGQGAWAAALSSESLPPSMQRYGEAIPEERLEELDGEWAHILVGGLYGGLGSALNYTVVYYGNDWDWYDFSRSTAIGVVSGAVAALFGGPFYSTVAGSLSSGLLDRWW